MAGYKGHLTAGIISAAALAYVYPKINVHSDLLALTAVTASVVVGSVLPDIDHPRSILGSRVKFISKPLYKIFGHRTITHSLFFTGFIGWLLSYWGESAIGLGICVGMLSHILLDLLCMGDGVAFLYPLYPRKIYFNLNFYFKKFFKKSLPKFRRKFKKSLKKCIKALS